MNYHHRSYYEEHGNRDHTSGSFERPILQTETSNRQLKTSNKRYGAAMDGTQHLKAGRRYEEFSTNNIHTQLEIARKRAVKMMQQRKSHHIKSRSKRHSTAAMQYFFKGDGTFGTGVNGIPNYFNKFET